MNLIETKKDVVSLDEVFKNCSACGKRWLYAYWDMALECYIYLAAENAQNCVACRE